MLKAIRTLETCDAMKWEEHIMHVWHGKSSKITKEQNKKTHTTISAVRKPLKARGETIWKGEIIIWLINWLLKALDYITCYAATD